MANRSKIRLTKAKLIYLAKQPRKFKPETIKMLERVLVHGDTQKEVATACKVTQQYLSSRVTELLKRLSDDVGNVPEDCIATMVIVHKDFLGELDALQKKSIRKSLIST